MIDQSRPEHEVLSREELELVSAARHPELSRMDLPQLAALVKALRQQCDPERGRHHPGAADGDGSRTREHFLGAALSRAEDELRKREEVAEDGRGRDFQA